MKVVYSAPNRGHHFNYANALQKAGALKAFISGFPRFSSHHKILNLGKQLHHVDFLQTLYLLSLRVGLPTSMAEYLAYLAKGEQDFACKKFLDNSDIFLFYSGSGLYSSRIAKNLGVVTIVEAVNSHVEYQENLLQQEHQKHKLPWKPFPKKEKEKRLKEYHEADHILLPSEFVKNSFIEMGIPEKKLLKVCYGFNSWAGTTDNHTPACETEFSVLYVGSISVRKGLRYLIEAFKKLRTKNKKLVLVGPDTKDGSLDGIVLTPEIVFTGPLKGQQLEEAYKAASVFCLPSIEEGLALVLGEALSFGLPIIATCNSGATDIITNGLEGFVVGVGDDNAILRRLQELADDSDLLLSMKKNAVQKAQSLNGWEETGNQLIRTLRNAINK